MVVPSDERAAAGGVTTLARSLGLLAAPPFLGLCMAAPPGSAAFDAPFYVAGGVKIVYDLVVWREFAAARTAS